MTRPMARLKAKPGINVRPKEILKDWKDLFNSSVFEKVVDAVKEAHDLEKNVRLVFKGTKNENRYDFILYVYGNYHVEFDMLNYQAQTQSKSQWSAKEDFALSQITKVFCLMHNRNVYLADIRFEDYEE